jgi:hypothetical protein
MPQFRHRPGAPGPDPAVQLDRALTLVNEGVDVGEEHVTVRAQLHRLGYDEVRQLAAKIRGDAEDSTWPSDRTLRRWGQEGRVPDAALAEAIRRADQVARLGGVDEAARQLGRSRSTVYRWRRGEKVGADTADRVSKRDTAERRSSAGIPVNSDGEVIQPGWLNASGDVEVKGTSTSDTYERHRNIYGIQLDLETTRALVEARENGDEQGALAAIEAYLSTDYAQCEGYGDDYGWHFQNLDSFDVSW